MSEKRVVLVTGGARSGKSAFAERLAGELGRRVLYVATALPLDAEMRRRIDLHQQRRPAHWGTLEVGSKVGPALAESARACDVVLIDCLAVLVSNLLVGEGNEIEEDRLDDGLLEERVKQEVEGILAAARRLPVSLIIVSNEVGLGLVPAYRSGRLYRDLLGRANQMVAAEADEVYLVVAGLPLELKRLAIRVESPLPAREEG